MTTAAPSFDIQCASQEAAGLGESPLWHPQLQCLFYIDIPRKQLLRLGAEGEIAQRWALDSEPGCIARIEGDDEALLLACRDGLWRFHLSTGARQPLSPPPYDPAAQRFNDGKPDPAGRFWVGGIDDARAPAAALYCYEGGGFSTQATGITTFNGLSWSPDARRMVWSDTKAHEIYISDYDLTTGRASDRRVLARFEPRAAGQDLASYGGRPDGGAMDQEGCYWVAMYEGQQLLRLAPGGEVLQRVALPVRCPTMPCFGGADMRTLYITTACDKRPAEELAAQPWAGHVLSLRVAVAGQAIAAARLAPA